MEFEHYSKNVEEVTFENQISHLIEQLKTDPLNDEKSTQQHTLHKKLRSVVTSRRFRLTQKKYYCTFYRSDLDPPDKVSYNPKCPKSEHKQQVIMIQLSVNLN